MATVVGMFGLPFESGVQPIDGWGAPAIDILLRQEFGDHAGLLLDSQGRIAAINNAAAELLGRTREKLIGTELGVWASQFEQVDLDVVRQVEGATKVRVVRATRNPSAPEDTYVPISLDEVRDPRLTGDTSLAHAVFAGLISANRNIVEAAGQEYRAPASIGRLPDLSVPVESIEAIRKTVEFTIRMASVIHPKTSVEFLGWGSSWVEIQVALDLEGKDPTEAFGVDIEFPHFPVEHLHCSLMFEFPQLKATLRIPYRG